MLVVLIGLVVSTVIALLVRRRTRRVPVISVVTTHGFSDDALSAIRDEPGDAELTVTLQGGREFKTTAEQARKHLTVKEGAAPSWVESIGSNKLAIVLAVVGYVISIGLFFLSDT